MKNFTESLEITFKNWMKVYGLISVSLLIMVVTDSIVNPEDFDSPLYWFSVIGWGILLVVLFSTSIWNIIPVLIPPMTYWLCVFVAGKRKYLVWLNYRPNSYVFVILLTIVWLLVIYVTSLITGGIKISIIIPLYVLLGFLMTVNYKKLVRKYRMNTDGTAWSLLLIFTILLIITGGDFISIPLILIFFIITAFGENWYITPRNYTKYFLIIDIVIYLVIIVGQTQLKEQLSFKSVMSFIGCTAISMILLKLQNRCKAPRHTP